MTDSEFDTRDFRDTLGRFATGVTVVTARAEDGTPVGLTVSSFNAVSLEPPLILWSLDRGSSTLAAFDAASHFAVNVLSIDQLDLSNLFASRAEDKFRGLDCSDGAGGAPLLPGCIATFQCRSWQAYDGGDHVIYVGEVVAFDRGPGTALLFHDGAYGAAGTLPEAD